MEKNFKLALRVQKNVNSGNMHCIVSWCFVDVGSFARKDSQHGDLEYAWATIGDDYWMTQIQCQGNAYIRSFGEHKGTWGEIDYNLYAYNIAQANASKLTTLAKKLDWIEKALDKYANKDNHGSPATFADYVFRLMHVTKCEYLIMPKNEGSEYAFKSRKMDSYCLDLLRQLLIVPTIERVPSEA
jgi:hypothetical protein